MNDRVKRLMMITALSRLAILVVIFAGYRLLPFCVSAHDANFVYPIGEEAGLVSAFKTWDANHYLYLADQWYSPFHISNAFYPLFPLLVKAVSVLTFGHAVVAGFLLSIVCTTVAVAFLYKLVCKSHGEETAYDCCLMLLAFPTAFYLGLVYSESVFLLLAVALFYYLGENRVAPAAVCALLLPLSRPTGVLVLAPVAVALFLEYRAPRPFDYKKLLLPLATVAGFLIYFVIMKMATGDFFAGFDAQKLFIAQNSVSNLLHPVNWFVHNFIDVDFSLNGFTTSILNRIFFAVFVLLAGLSWRRVGKTLFAFLVVLGTVPALSGYMTSYMRYVLMAFPIFITLAMLFRKRISWYMVPAIFIQLVLLLAHATNNWVA